MTPHPCHLCGLSVLNWAMVFALVVRSQAHSQDQLTHPLTALISNDSDPSSSSSSPPSSSSSSLSSQASPVAPHPLTVAIISSPIPGLVFLSYKENGVVQFNYTLACDHPSTKYTLVVTSTHPEVAVIKSGSSINVSCHNAFPDNSNTNNNNSDNNGNSNNGNNKDKNNNNSNNNNNNNKNNARDVLLNNAAAAAALASSNNSDTQGGANMIQFPRSPPSSGGGFVSEGRVMGSFNVTVGTKMIGRSFLLIIANKIGGPLDKNTTATRQVAGLPPNAADHETETSSSSSPKGDPLNNSGDHGNVTRSKLASSYHHPATNLSNVTGSESDKIHGKDGAIMHGDSGEGGRGGGGGGAGGGGGRGGGERVTFEKSKISQRGGVAGAMSPNMVLKAMILVVKFPTIHDEIFRISSYIIIVLATMGMGIKVDVRVIAAVLKKPLAPSIGLFAQYVCMPLIAYGVAKLVPQPTPAVALGIFTCGIVPGGGASNLYCYLLGGDVSLSVTMTTISSIAAMGLIPFWMYTLGDTFQDEMSSVHVPFLRILETLAFVVLPIFAGIIIKYKAPKAAKYISKILKPVLLIVVIFFIAAAIYLNMYVFEMIKPMQILAGCLLPYIGYVIGGLLALTFRQSWTRVKTIAIETGIQNVGIAFLILYLSLPPPDNLLSIVGPAASGIMTPLPLLVITVAYLINNKCKAKKRGKDGSSSDGSDGDGNDEKFLEHTRYGSSDKGKERGIWAMLIRYFKDSDKSDAAQEMLSKDVTIVDETSDRSRVDTTINR